MYISAVMWDQALCFSFLLFLFVLHTFVFVVHNDVFGKYNTIQLVLIEA